MDEKKFLVGFDLCNDYTQISCYSYKTYEPISIYLDEEDKEGLIPTVLCHSSSLGWLFGQEAKEYAKSEKILLATNILGNIKDEGRYKINNKEYTGIDLLEKFFRRTFSLLRRYFPQERITQIVVTTRDMDPAIVNGIYEALSRLAIEKDRAKVISHSNSYLYYALSMDKEIWLNDVGLFDFNERGFFYYQISINRRHAPMIAGVSKFEFTDILSIDMLLDKHININYALENILNHALYKKLISTIYFTGQGFDGDWADETIKTVCSGRRVFLGQNLYTKGACYAAKELSGDESLKDFIFLSSEMLTSSVSIAVYKDGKVNDMILVPDTIFFDEVDQSMEVILDDENQIEFIVRNIMTRKTVREKLIMDNLPNRPRKMTRLEIKAKCPNEREMNIEVRDLGFGDLYPSTSGKWELNLELL